MFHAMWCQKLLLLQNISYDHNTDTQEMFIRLLEMRGKFPWFHNNTLLLNFKKIAFNLNNPQNDNFIVRFRYCIYSFEIMNDYLYTLHTNKKVIKYKIVWCIIYFVLINPNTNASSEWHFECIRTHCCRFDQNRLFYYYRLRWHYDLMVQWASCPIEALVERLPLLWYACASCPIEALVERLTLLWDAMHLLSFLINAVYTPGQGLS